MSAAGRPSTKGKEQAIKLLLIAFAAGGDVEEAVEEVREQFDHVPASTWRRWVAEAKKIRAKAVGDGGVAAKPERYSKSTKAPEGTQGGTKPAPDPEPVTEPQLNEEGTAALMPTAFGVKVYGVTERLAKPEVMDVSSPLDYLRRHAILMCEAEALRDSAVQSVANGTKHIITDPKSFAKSIELRRDLDNDILEAMEKATSQEQVNLFMDTIVETVKATNPKAADKIMSSLRSVMQAKNPTLWQALTKSR